MILTYRKYVESTIHFRVWNSSIYMILMLYDSYLSDKINNLVTDQLSSNRWITLLLSSGKCELTPTWPPAKKPVFTKHKTNCPDFECGVFYTLHSCATYQSALDQDQAKFEKDPPSNGLSVWRDQLVLLVNSTLKFVLIARLAQVQKVCACQLAQQLQSGTSSKTTV